eukprot:scaffold67087_cov79-Phaeocystis_antarctica.AAC.4
MRLQGDGCFQWGSAAGIFEQHVAACVEQQLNDLLSLIAERHQRKVQWRLPVWVNRVYRRPSFEQGMDEAWPHSVLASEVEWRVAGTTDPVHECGAVPWIPRAGRGIRGEENLQALLRAAGWRLLVQSVRCVA